MKKAKAETKPERSVSDYAIFVAFNGVAYLRVATSPKNGGRFLIHTGKSIELVELAANVIKARQLRIVPNADVLDAAKSLAKPVGEGVKPSKRAAVEIESILKNKELHEMKTAKEAAKKSAKSEAKKSAATKSSPAVKGEKAAKKSAKKESNGEARGRRSNFEDGAKITKAYKEPPYREGSARQTLLDQAIKAGTVEKFYKAAGKPSGGSASAYLHLFVKAGHLKVA